MEAASNASPFRAARGKVRNMSFAVLVLSCLSWCDCVGAKMAGVVVDACGESATRTGCRKTSECPAISGFRPQCGATIVQTVVPIRLQGP